MSGANCQPLSGRLTEIWSYNGNLVVYRISGRITQIWSYNGNLVVYPVSSLIPCIWSYTGYPANDLILKSPNIRSILKYLPFVVEAFDKLESTVRLHDFTSTIISFFYRLKLNIFTYFHLLCR